jgi:predicted ester cyclase
MSESNKQLIRLCLESVSGKEKTESLIHQYVEDENLVQNILEMEYAFPKYEIMAEDMIEENDKVVLRATIQARHEGEWMGILATGVKVAVPIMVIYQIRGGKIVHHWMNADMLALMQQIGAILQPEHETNG